MKTTCPNCKYILDFDEAEYVPGEIAHLECPMCGQEVNELIKEPEPKAEVEVETKPVRKPKLKSDSSSTSDAVSPKPNYPTKKTSKRPTGKKNSLSQQPFNEQEVLEKAGCWGIGFSILFPIIGVILYFNQKNKVENAKVYLWCALISFIIGWYFSSK